MVRGRAAGQRETDLDVVPAPLTATLSCPPRFPPGAQAAELGDSAPRAQSLCQRPPRDRSRASLFDKEPGRRPRPSPLPSPLESHEVEAMTGRREAPVTEVRARAAGTAQRRRRTSGRRAKGARAREAAMSQHPLPLPDKQGGPPEPLCRTESWLVVEPGGGETSRAGPVSAPAPAPLCSLGSHLHHDHRSAGSARRPQGTLGQDFSEPTGSFGIRQVARERSPR